MKHDLAQWGQRSLPQRLASSWFGARSGAALRAALGLVSLAAAALLAWVVVQAADERRQTQRREDALAQLQRRKLPKPVAAPAAMLTANQARTLEGTVERLNLPWPRMLDDLERHTPPSVAVLQIEPDVGSASLRLLVEAKSAEDLFAYLEALKSARSLQHLRVAKFETNTQDAARPARFLLQADIARDTAEPQPGVSGRSVAAAVSGAVR